MKKIILCLLLLVAVIGIWSCDTDHDVSVPDYTYAGIDYYLPETWDRWWDNDYPHYVTVTSSGPYVGPVYIPVPELWLDWDVSQIWQSNRAIFFFSKDDQQGWRSFEYKNNSFYFFDTNEQ